MFWIPGHSYRGALLPLSALEKELSKNLSAHVWMLAGDIGARSLTSAPSNLEKAANYIEFILRDAGYSPEKEEFMVEVFDQNERKVSAEKIIFNTVQRSTCNVIGEIKGSAQDPEIIIVGAHYDSLYECAAANDNGSGVSAMLEIARMVRYENLKHTLRFVAFTNEEPPFFRTEQMGSFQHAQGCKKRNEKIKAMICLETIGYFSDHINSQRFPHPALGLIFPKKGNFITFISNLKSAALLRRSIASFRNTTKFPSEAAVVPFEVKGADFSDQYNFWNLGYPAIMVTDTAFYRYPHYHEMEDTPDKIDFEKLARVVAGLYRMVKDLAQS